jgi:hypothetical protein
MRTRTLLTVLAGSLAMAAAACSVEEDTTAGDAAPADAGDVATGDASTDTMPDSAPDAGADTAVDVAPDTTPDPDASPDASADASPDASPDASADAAPDSGAASPTWSDVDEIIFETCAGCHYGEPAGLGLVDAYDRLVGVASTQLPTMNRVTAGSLEDSYLWHKVSGTHLDIGGTGDRMPRFGELGADELEVIRQWILGGALP